MSPSLRAKLFAICGVLLAGVALALVLTFELHPRGPLAIPIAIGSAILLSAFASKWMADALTRRDTPRATSRDTATTPEPPQSGAPGEVADLAGERDRLETILECMHEAVIALDDRDRITIANDAAFDLLGFDDDDVERPLLDAVSVPELLELAHECQRRPNDEVSAEFRLPMPPHAHALAKAAPLKKMGGAVIVIHDVTEVRQLERMRRDFVANVSHELRTPVSVIRANAETLLDGALQDEAKAPSFVEAIHRNAERLSILVSDLLDLSRIEAGKLATDVKPVVLRNVTDTVAESLVLRADERGIRIANEVDEAVVVEADPNALTQVLQNLMDNAVTYAPSDGHVWIRAHAHNDRIRLEVEDDGPGIAPEHRERVFERFYRVDAGRSRAVGGTGLGLAIVKHLSEAMGGDVGVEPAPKRGSIFWVELPPA